MLKRKLWDEIKGDGIDGVYFLIDGNVYTPVGWHGCQLMSEETFMLPVGEERLIKDAIIHVYRTERVGLRYETYWTIDLEDTTIDDANKRIRAFLRSMPGMKYLTGNGN